MQAASGFQTISGSFFSLDGNKPRKPFSLLTDPHPDLTFAVLLQSCYVVLAWFAAGALRGQRQYLTERATPAPIPLFLTPTAEDELVPLSESGEWVCVGGSVCNDGCKVTITATPPS